jgi:hypothetical protein
VRKSPSTRYFRRTSRGMLQTSEASRRSRGTHGGACHVVVLEQSDKRRRTRNSAGRIRERNMAAGRQPGRCPNVGGALRAAIERQAGARCPHATSWLCSSYRTVGSVGTPSALPPPWASRLPRHFVALWFLPYGRIARDSLHRTRRPLVVPRGDFEATRFAAPKFSAPGHASHLVPNPVRTLSFPVPFGFFP